MTTARDKFFYTRTLCSLLKALEGLETEIELRNEAHVKGTVESVSASMSVTMRNCDLTVAGRARKLERFLVQGRKIRMVIIPDDVNMIGAMQSVISMYNNPVLGKDEFRKIGLKGRGRVKSRGRGSGRGRGMAEQNVLGRGRGAVGNVRGRGQLQNIRSTGDTERLTGRGDLRTRGRRYSPIARGRPQRQSDKESDATNLGCSGGMSFGSVVAKNVFGQPLDQCGGSAKQYSMLNPEYMQVVSATKTQKIDSAKTESEKSRQSSTSDHMQHSAVSSDARLQVDSRTPSVVKSSSRSRTNQEHTTGKHRPSSAVSQGPDWHRDRSAKTAAGSTQNQNPDRTKVSVVASDLQTPSESVAASGYRSGSLSSTDLRHKLGRHSSPVSQASDKKQRAKSTRTMTSSGLLQKTTSSRMERCEEHFPPGSSYDIGGSRSRRSKSVDRKREQHSSPHRHRAQSRERTTDQHECPRKHRDRAKDRSSSPHREKHHRSSGGSHHSHASHSDRRSTSPSVSQSMSLHSMTVKQGHGHYDSDTYCKTWHGKHVPTDYSDERSRKSSHRRSSQSSRKCHSPERGRTHSASRSHRKRDQSRWMAICGFWSIWIRYILICDKTVIGSMQRSGWY